MPPDINKTASATKVEFLGNPFVFCVVRQTCRLDTGSDSLLEKEKIILEYGKGDGGSRMPERERNKKITKLLYSTTRIRIYGHKKTNITFVGAETENL